MLKHFGQAKCLLIHPSPILPTSYKEVSSIDEADDKNMPAPEVKQARNLKTAPKDYGAKKINPSQSFRSLAAVFTGAP